MSLYRKGSESGLSQNALLFVSLSVAAWVFAGGAKSSFAQTNTHRQKSGI